ncbi:MAG: PH domain-containing protein [Proteobacteria bacterium]|nr:PH domain-containing protein [Pseudomonadota bacterium]
MNGLGIWSKRFCVLCGARLFIFSSSRPKGKPFLVLDLIGGKMTEYKSKKSYYCVKVSASHKEILLAFDSRLEQSKWLESAAKVRFFA